MKSKLFIITALVILLNTSITDAGPVSSGDGSATVTAGGSSISVSGLKSKHTGRFIRGASIGIRNRTAGEKTFTYGTTGIGGNGTVKLAGKKGDVIDIVIIWTEGKSKTKRRITASGHTL